MTQNKVNRNRRRCPECGAPFFQDVEFRQYSVVPSAEPGGGVQAGDVACRARVCLCGDVVLLGLGSAPAVPAEVRQEFERAAERHWARIDTCKMHIRLTCDFVPRTEFDALAERAAALQHVLQQLLQASGGTAGANTPG